MILIIIPLFLDLTVFFEPASYDVTEGETATLILATNIGYDFDFKVNVSMMDGTAMGKYNSETKVLLRIYIFYKN